MSTDDTSTSWWDALREPGLDTRRLKLLLNALDSIPQAMPFEPPPGSDDAGVIAQFALDAPLSDPVFPQTVDRELVLALAGVALARVRAGAPIDVAIGVYVESGEIPHPADEPLAADAVKSLRAAGAALGAMPLPAHATKPWPAMTTWLDQVWQGGIDRVCTALVTVRALRAWQAAPSMAIEDQSKAIEAWPTWVALAFERRSLLLLHALASGAVPAMGSGGLSRDQLLRDDALEAIGAFLGMPPTIAADRSMAVRDPQDAPEDLAQLAKASRGLFATRQEYNFFVCDELAVRGQAPNSSNVAQVGRWGNSNAIAADVREWYARLAKKLAQSRADVPIPLRQSSNRLIEQLWSQARDWVWAMAEREGRTQGSSAAMGSAAERLYFDRVAHANELRQSEHRHEQARAELQSRLEQLEAHALAQAATAAQALRTAAEREAELQSQLGAAQRQCGEAQQARDQTALQLAETRASLERETQLLVTQLDATRREAAQNVDWARQEAKRAGAREDECRRAASAAREEFAAQQLRSQQQLNEVEAALRQERSTARETTARLDDVTTALKRLIHATRNEPQLADQREPALALLRRLGLIDTLRSGGEDQASSPA